MKKIHFNSLFFIACLLSGFLVFPEYSFAKTDLSITDTDITFSKDTPIKGDSVRIFARVYNIGDTDVRGYVSFLINDKEIDDPQAISVKSGTYDDVFVDWTPENGYYNIKAKITGASLTDDNLDNNSTEKKNFLVDLDTDKDGIPDTKDLDSDNDGLANDKEKSLGTNSLVADTDGDGVDDSEDAFPKDSTESKDTDGDGLGDVKDIDDDGDGILDMDEINKYGTNSLNADTDDDGLNDDKEIKAGANPIKIDTDNDGVNDSKDAYPADSSKWEASLFDSLSFYLKENNGSIYFILGIPVALIIIYLMFRRKKRRR